MHTLVNYLKSCPLALRLLVWCALYLHGASSVAHATDFCALSFHVVDSSGKPIGRTWIELTDASGKTERREMMEGPDFKICDFGFGEHTLHVGTNECLPVAISGLRVVFGSPISLDVVLNACGYRNMRSACLVYFRVVDSNGKPIPGVQFSPPLTFETSQSDSYGRWQGLAKGSHVLTFEKAGYSPNVVRIQCRDDEEIDHFVVMRNQ
jgi:hypothetical protein